MDEQLQFQARIQAHRDQDHIRNNVDRLRNLPTSIPPAPNLSPVTFDTTVVHEEEEDLREADEVNKDDGDVQKRIHSSTNENKNEVQQESFIPFLRDTTIDNNINIINYDETDSKIETESENLQSFATRLSTLSRLLDTRAKTLHAAESQLEQEQLAVKTHHQTLTTVEQRARQHLSDLLNDISNRQSSLSIREQRLKRTRQILESRLSSARTLLPEVSRITRELPIRRKELDVMERRLDDHKRAVEDARVELADIKLKREWAFVDTNRLMKDRRVLEGAMERVQVLDKDLREREVKLSEKEKIIEERMNGVIRFEALERIVNPLQHLLDELCFNFSKIDIDDNNNETSLSEVQDNINNGSIAPDVKSDTGNAVLFAISKISEMRESIRKIQQSKSILNIQKLQLEEMDENIKKQQSTLQIRLNKVSNEERRLQKTKQNIQHHRSELLNKERSLEELSNRLENREESLRIKEEGLISRDQDLGRREVVLSGVERLLERKERSATRALAGVQRRERAVEGRERDTESERDVLNGLRKELEIRESLLHTRNLELSTRLSSDIFVSGSLRERGRGRIREIEEENGSRVGDEGGDERLVSPGVDGASSSQMMPPRESVEGTAVTNTTIRTTLEQRCVGSATTPDRNDVIQDRLDATQAQSQQQTTAATTVRRHLAFDSTMKNPNPNQTTNAPVPTTTGTTITHEHEQQPQSLQQDNESETAAEQLLPELMSARELWREKITRLQQVVENMRENTWTTRSHVKPVLSKVASTLQSLLTQVNISVDTDMNTSKEAYTKERAIQVKWSSLLKEQLDSVREVQTGMLIGMRDGYPVSITSAANDSSSYSHSHSHSHSAGEGGSGSGSGTGVKDHGSSSSTVSMTGITEGISHTNTHGTSATKEIPPPIDEIQQGTLPSGWVNSSYRENSTTTATSNQVEATLDATIDYETGTARRSFEIFRERMRHRTNDSGNNIGHVRFGGLGLGGDRRLTFMTTTADPVVSPHAANFLGELASLRNELRGITGFSDTQ